MVATIRIPETEQVAVVITPYAPLSLRASVLILLLICIPIMAVAVVSGLLGNWYAMPASLTMCVVLCLAFRSGYRRTHCREVVTLADGAVSIERGYTNLESHCALPGEHAYVLLQDSAPDAREHHLYLCADEQKVEVGEFLDDRERGELAEVLRQLIRSAGRMRPILTT
ncbi:DUF2244 domain-containing protein [Sulfuritalea hydrogenivorans]|jgi:uncharacterized membrane protein|uniref:Integral membrane protein n=1 Tax=Sulfuritalea hydrogenivorans sk43H TaxID=1223802 RepID=W0SHX9_9PROT|nr:DUF2244 domain-containing protein [Sulfuritalea hydrogenivorans]MDK9715781.1 DUF2244 domain-containing protein [Sulfuritalea sp.]BAO29543.1 hypothetical protein SUTH_01751 [Sulfuritalea hydrogenivorans sk43H]